MSASLDVIFCNLLRIGLGHSQDFPYALTEKEWQALLTMAKQQTVLGVFFNAVSRLPVESRPPRVLLMRLSLSVEAIRGTNNHMNQESARYTHLFMEYGFKSVILKGQANARLYPDPLARQAGDIDIWVPGGYDKVKSLLLELGLVSENDVPSKKNRHIGFRCKGIEIEVHHRPAEISFNNKEFQEVLRTELDNSTLTPEGFYAPSIRFALIMQLEHLYRHCIREGVGLRHFMDYFVLLSHSSEADREFVWGKVNRFGLGHACAGIMWVLGEVFGLSEGWMLCQPDSKFGSLLYKSTLNGGNFGRSSLGNTKGVFWLKRWFYKRMYALQWIRFDPLNTVIGEIRYWKSTILLIPERIKRRKMFL
ncbi:MAG: nucleotidyltransferase family protein [Fibrobacter sp.]|nr:nucleotidyltransferase family protein [Fibrobacter sp.]